MVGVDGVLLASTISISLGRIDVQVAVDPMKTGSAIGKEGRNIKLFKDAVSRLFEIGNNG